MKKIQLFRQRWEIVWHFYLDMEEEIEKRWTEELRVISDDGQDSNGDLRQQLSVMDMRYHNLVREGMLIQVCSLVEYTLRLISRIVVADYKKKMPGGKGNWLKHLKLLRETVKMGLEEEDISLFQDFWTLRNCVAHVGGQIGEDSNPEKIRDIICKLQKLGEKSNTTMVGETKDGYLLLGADITSEVVIRGGKILLAVFRAIC